MLMMMLIPVMLLKVVRRWSRHWHQGYQLRYAMVVHLSPGDFRLRTHILKEEGIV
jgi:hypothetical protein